MTSVSTLEIVKPAPEPSKFLTQMEQAAMRHGHTEAAAAAMVDWSRRFILFHGKQNPQEKGRAEVAAFLEHVAKTDAPRAIAAALSDGVLVHDLPPMGTGRAPLAAVGAAGPTSPPLAPTLAGELHQFQIRQASISPDALLE